MEAMLAALRAGDAGAAREALPRLRNAANAAPAPAPFPPGSLDQLVAVVQAHGAGPLRPMALEAVCFMLRGHSAVPARDALAKENLTRWGEPRASTTLILPRRARYSAAAEREQCLAFSLH